jgi:hypothetical protein
VAKNHALTTLVQSKADGYDDMRSYASYGKGILCGAAVRMTVPPEKLKIISGCPNALPAVRGNNPVGSRDDDHGRLGRRSSNEPVDQEQQNGAADRHKESGGGALRVEAKRAPEIRSDERSRDSEQDRNDHSAWISPRHEEFGDGSYEQSNEQRPD